MLSTNEKRDPHCNADCRPRDGAIAYATAGWAVFPVPPGEKKSYKAAKHSDGRRWGLTKNLEEIRANWERWPNANIGIATGVASGFFVIDADTLEGHGVDGIASLRELIAAKGPLPKTRMAESPSGSLHFFFTHPGEGIKIKNSDSELAPGVDVKGDGGMVIAPPSFRNGIAYRWLNDLPIAEPPAWLLDLVKDQIRERPPGGKPETDPAIIAAALAVIPNEDLGWEEWNRIGMAAWRATGGDGEGFAAFDSWSKKSKKYDAHDTVKKWDSYFSSPPDRIGAGTIFHLANEADPGWGNRYDAKLEARLRPVDPKQSDESSKSEQKPPPPRSPIELVRASDIVIRPKSWIWEGHLLRGALELTTGIPGLGKSQVQCHFVGCASAGLKWPNGSPALGPMNVIMVTAEDALDTEVVPRLIAAGANLERVHILKCIRADRMRQRQFLLNEDLLELERVIKQMGEVGLITIDPITAYMGGKMDSHKTTEVRSQLGPLKDFAERTNVALSAITHPPKSASQRAIDHFIGSQAFIASARIGHVVIEETKEEGEGKTGRVLFTNCKHNSHVEMPTLAYRINELTVGQDSATGESIVAPRVVWDEGAVHISADEAVAKKAQPRDEAQKKVQAFLRDLLSSGEPVDEAVIREHGEQRGFTIKQLRTAKEKLGVKSAKDSFNGGWRWVWPM
jgi:hypothetical protein